MKFSAVRFPGQLAAFSLFALSAMPAFAHEPGAHVHGVATLQVAVDEKILTLDFSSPLDNLLGFEHVPHNEQQKAAVRSMTEQLNKADRLFIPSAAALCSLQSVHLESPVIESPAIEKQPNTQQAGHADLDAEFVFKCAHTDKLRDLQVNLFASFPNLHQLNAEVASAHGQAAARLTPEKRSLSW